MNLGLFRREHLGSGDARLIGNATADQFQKTHGAIQAWEETEHKDNGAHAAVTADSLLVAGGVTILGEGLTPPAVALQVNGQIRSTRTDGGGTGSMIIGANSNGGDIEFEPDPGFAAFDPVLAITGDLRVFQSVDPAVPAIAANGLIQADLGYLERGRLVPMGIWQDYTPVWGSSGVAPSLGNGVINGRYTLIGHTVAYELRVAFGLSTTFGTGLYTFSLPTNARPAFTGLTSPIATGGGFDASTGFRYAFFAYLASANTVVLTDVVPPGTIVQATVPVTWAAGDSLYCNGTYELQP